MKNTLVVISAGPACAPLSLMWALRVARYYIKWVNPR